MEPLELLVIYGSVRHHRQGIRAARFIDAQLRRRGHATTFITAGGTGTERARATSQVIEADWVKLGPAGIARAVREAAPGHAWTVIACAPELLDALPDALAGPVHLCVHSVPGALESWYSAAELDAFRVLLAAGHRSGRAAISAASSRQAADHAAALGLPAGAVRTWPPGVRPPAGVPPPAAGPPRRFAVVARLAPEKLGAVRMAAALVAAARAQGREAVLDVHGDGPAREALAAELAATLPRGAWTLHGATRDPWAALATADAAVATGAAAIEALMLARRVAAAPSGPDGGAGPAVTPATYDDLAADNLGWRGRSAVAAEETLAGLDALTGRDLLELQRRARNEYSPAQLADRGIALVDGRTNADEGGRALLAGVAEHAAATRARAKASDALGHELWVELELARKAARGVTARPAETQNDDEPPRGRLV